MATYLAGFVVLYIGMVLMIFGIGLQQEPRIINLFGAFFPALLFVSGAATFWLVVGPVVAGLGILVRWLSVRRFSRAGR